MRTYHFPLDLVRERSPERPVALVRPAAVSVAARWFQDNLKADVFYAVKANPSRWVIETLVEAGVTAFDVASLAEIELVRSVMRRRTPGLHAPGEEPRRDHQAPISTTASAPSRSTARTSCRRSSTRTGGATDLNLIVRMAVSAEGAAYTPVGQVRRLAGSGPVPAAVRRRAVDRRADGRLLPRRLAVHAPDRLSGRHGPGRPRRSARAGVFVDIVDVGGGFPSVYPGMVPPDMSEYVDAIHRGFNEMPVSETTELWCEPGRALVAESSSILTRVDLRKGDALYLNDGVLWLAVRRDPLALALPDQAGPGRRGARTSLKPFQFYGPTCDSIDHMPGPFWLPADIREGDFIEIGMLGAYGVAMSTGFNGYGEHETRRGRGRPDGLAVRPRPALHPDRAHHGRGDGAQGRPSVASQGQGRSAQEGRR